VTGILPPDFPFAAPGPSPPSAEPPAQPGGGALGAGVGTLSMVVWPTHAGAVMSNGQEPMFVVDYKRGQIFWEVNEKGTILGRATVEVPAGEWAWIIYCHNPLEPGFVTCQKLAHPLVLTEPGAIALHDITEEEVRPLNPDPVLHD
jgi:hypothetical protein